jgi:hypothetical protein
VFEDLSLHQMVNKPKAKQDENGKYLHNGASAKAGLNKSILEVLDGEASSSWLSTRQNGPVSPSMRWIQRKPARCVAHVGRRGSTKISVFGHTCAFTVGLCSTGTITLHETSLTEGLDGAHANLSLRVCSVGLLCEAPAFMRGESSQYAPARGSRHIF